MGYRFSIGLLAISALMLTAPAAAPASGEADSLWSRAVSLHEANANRFPGSIYMHVQEVDKHGEPKDKKGNEIWSRLFLNEDGEVEGELLRAMEDGEDVTEREKAKIEEEKAERGEEEGDEEGYHMEGYEPFDPEHGDDVTFTRTGEEEVVSGRRCAVYEFEGTLEEEEDDGDIKEYEVLGRTWLDVETGVPYKLEYTTDPLPKRVKKMVTTVFYEFESPDIWQAGSMSVKATGGILFIKKHFHMNMSFSDYWAKPGEEREVQEDSGINPVEAIEADSAGE